MIKNVTDALTGNILYSLAVALLLGWFVYTGFSGMSYYQDNGVQRNAGYSGPVPHSGYGVRFYHK